MFKKIIKLYQGSLFRDRGSCRYVPVCSDYCLEALKKRGTIVGVFLCIKRVVKCSPFFKPGHDPVSWKAQKS